MVVSTYMTVFWVAAPCSLVEVYQSFRGPCNLHHYDYDDGGNKQPLNDVMLSKLHKATTQKTATLVSKMLRFILAMLNTSPTLKNGRHKVFKSPLGSTAVNVLTHSETSTLVWHNAFSWYISRPTALTSDKLFGHCYTKLLHLCEKQILHSSAIISKFLPALV
jgi:hypothetical protein